MTLLIIAQFLRAKLGGVWSGIAVWIMAVDPANILPSRVDLGPTVLMHFFQAAIFALWLSYFDVANASKLVLIFVVQFHLADPGFRNHHLSLLSRWGTGGCTTGNFAGY